MLFFFFLLPLLGDIFCHIDNTLLRKWAVVIIITIIIISSSSSSTGPLT